IIGFTATYLFHFVVVGGHLISRDIGISMGGATDPIQDESGDEMGVFLLLIFSAAFLVKGYHLYFIRVILESFQYIPMGHFGWDMRSVAQILALMSASALLSGIKLAAPIILALLTTTLGMALMARVMPQMNVWIVSVPIKVILGVFIIWQTFPLMTRFFDANFQQVQEAIAFFLRTGALHGG
ncbi:MAG TPA: flagellar biosynthetic protein FliR, partial [Fibrobacteraceae bacterium]|nr:flagellar biosynthetic protein FliR [Fibrobacteraceae bacterium]